MSSTRSKIMFLPNLTTWSTFFCFLNSIFELRGQKLTKYSLPGKIKKFCWKIAKNACKHKEINDFRPSWRHWWDNFGLKKVFLQFSIFLFPKYSMLMSKEISESEIMLGLLNSFETFGPFTAHLSSNALRQSIQLVSLLFKV